VSALRATDRRAMLAKVHVAKKQMGLDLEDYRAVVLRVTGHASAADCTDHELHALLDEFQRLGWQPQSGTKRSNRPNVRMIYGIWAEMAPMLNDPSENALRSFVRRQTKSVKNPDGVGAPEWLDAAEARKVIEGLKGWLGRLQKREAAHG
jgi:phage gp16-like protein